MLGSNSVVSSVSGTDSVAGGGGEALVVAVIVGSVVEGGEAVVAGSVAGGEDEVAVVGSVVGKDDVVVMTSVLAAAAVVMTASEVGDRDISGSDSTDEEDVMAPISGGDVVAGS